MDIPINAEVFCRGNLCGHSVFVLMNPNNRQITHLVVSEQALPNTLRIVPIDLVVEGTSNLINLSCSPEDLVKMEPYIETEPLPPGLYAYGSLSIPIWPYTVLPQAELSLEHQRIPTGELAVRRGVRVESDHKLLGRLTEFLIDPATGSITFLILRKRRLFSKLDFAVPVSKINRIDQSDGIVSDIVAG